MAHVTHIGQAHHLALLIFQAAQALVQGPGLFAGLRRVHGCGAVAGHRVSHGVVQLLGDMATVGSAPAQHVQPTAAHDQTHPGHGGAQRRTVVGGGAPDGQKGLLQHVLCPVAVGYHAQGQAVELGGTLLVQNLESGIVLLRDALQQGN